MAYPYAVVARDNQRDSDEDNQRAVGSHFGACPTCEKSDGVRNYGRDHYFFCNEHRTFWPVGSNLFSMWRDEIEDAMKRSSPALSWEDAAELVKTETVAFFEGFTVVEHESQARGAQPPADDCPF